MTKVFLRSLLIQSLWNFERMQNLGFLYCLYPALLRLYPEGPRRRAAFERHLEYFNTHPYLANILVGISLWQEEKNAATGDALSQEIPSVKSRMAGPIAAIGDSFFWGAWRPFCALGAVVLIIFTQARSLWPCVLFLAVYNSIHLLVRWKGLSDSYQKGTAVVHMLGRMQLQRWVRWVHLAGFLLVAALLADHIFEAWWDREFVLVSITSLVVFMGFLRFGFSTTKLLYGAVLAGLIIGLI